MTSKQFHAILVSINLERKVTSCLALTQTRIIKITRANKTSMALYSLRNCVNCITSVNFRSHNAFYNIADFGPGLYTRAFLRPFTETRNLFDRITRAQNVTLSQHKQSMEEILGHIADTAEIVKTIKPVYNFKTVNSMKKKKSALLKLAKESPEARKKRVSSGVKLRAVVIESKKRKLQEKSKAGEDNELY